MGSGIIPYVGSLRRRGVDAVKADHYEFSAFRKIKNRPEPWSSSGNFAVTFRFTQIGFGGRSKKVGIRVWHAAIADDDLARYRALGPILKSLNQDSDSSIRFAASQLLEPPDEGFILKDGLKPLLIMDWNDGVDFDRHIKNIIFSKNSPNDKKRMFRNLKFLMMELFRFMHDKGVSHGDISSGNIMVEETPTGSKIHVVDFDSFFTPEIKGLRPTSVGHPDWQHPRYINGQLDLLGLKADYCPFLLMALTLEALATDTHLYDRYASISTDGSGILIRRNDLIDPQSSAVLSEMRVISDPILASHINDLDIILAAESETEIEFPTSLQSKYEAPPGIVTKVNRRIIEGGPPTFPRKSRKLLRGIFHKPEDVKTFLEKHQPTFTELMKNLVYNRDNRRNLRRIQGGEVEAYEICIEHFGGIDNVDATLLTPYAWALFYEGRKADARRIGEHVYSISPSNADNAHLLTSKIYGRQGEQNWERIIEIADKVLDESPGAVLVSCSKAQAERELGLHPTCEDAFEEALIRTNRNWKALTALVYDANRAHEFETAAEAFMEVLRKDVDNISKPTPQMISNLLLQGLYSLGRCSRPFSSTDGSMVWSRTGLDGFDIVDLLSEINTEILRLEERPPKENVISQIVKNLDIISEKSFDEQTMWIGMGVTTQDKLVHVLSALATLGLGEPIDGLDGAVQRTLSRTGARTPEGNNLHLSFDPEDPTCFEYGGSWMTYLSRQQMRGPPPGLE